jgi:nucleotide-binding universal stress UspA family protein
MTEADKRKVFSESGPSPFAFHSLLVPVDLTPLSDRVVSRAALLPLAENARVTLLHVIPGSLTPSERRSAERDTQKMLADEVRHLRRLVPRKIRVESLVTQGSAAAEIAACRSKVKAELVVMGRGGGSPLRDAFLGATAERVIRQTRMPVLAVRLPAREPYRRPALALDLEPAAQQVVRFMLRVLPPTRQAVDVVHAFDTPYGGLVYPSLRESEAEELKDELREKATRAVEKLLAASLAKADIPLAMKPVWKRHVRYGSPRAVVPAVMKKAETDLLVLGSRGYSGAAYAILGTVAGDLLRAAKCDVLAVPPVRSGT